MLRGDVTGLWFAWRGSGKLCRPRRKLGLEAERQGGSDRSAEHRSENSADQIAESRLGRDVRSFS